MRSGPLPGAVRAPSTLPGIRLVDHLALVAIPAFALAVALLLIYSFPKGDQVDHLVILRRVLNPGYLRNDWYATVSVESWVRMPYVFLLAGPVMLIGEAATFGILAALVSIGTVYLIGFTLFRAGAPLPAAVLAGLGTLEPPPSFFGVGDSQIIVYELYPANLAWLLAFGSLALCLSQRRMLAFIAAAAATLFTPTIGLLAYGAQLMLAIQRGDCRTPRSAMTFMFGGLLVLAWPALLLREGGTVQSFYFPSHWVLSSREPMEVHLPALGHVATVDHLYTVAFALALVALGWALGRRYHPLLYWTLVLAAAATVLSAVAGERGGPNFLLTLQGMRLSVVLGPLALGAGGWLAWDVGRVTPLRRLVEMALSPLSSVALLLLAAGLIAYAIVTPSPSLDPADAALRDAVIASTPKDAILLIPPDLSWFRVETDRAIVVDWKGWPFRLDNQTEYKARIEAIAPGFDGRSSAPFQFARDSYDAQPPQRLLEAADRYDATHILVRRQDLSCSGGRELLRLESGYVLYALVEAQWWDPARPCDDP